MKNLRTTATLVILAIFTASFTTLFTDKKVDIEKSTIHWKGAKVTGEHDGNIKLKEGTLTFNGDELTGGSFVVDMTTITNNDLSGNWNEKLVGHLKSDDFFGVANHPTSSLTFTKVEKNNDGYSVTADLTIKGITKPVTFDMEASSNSARAKLTIDRTLYDIKYGSASFFDNLKDKAISNDFDLTVDLVY